MSYQNNIRSCLFDPLVRDLKDPMFYMEKFFLHEVAMIWTLRKVTEILGKRLGYEKYTEGHLCYNDRATDSTKGY